jgi:hypothetical protein
MRIIELPLVVTYSEMSEHVTPGLYLTLGIFYLPEVCHRRRKDRLQPKSEVHLHTTNNIRQMQLLMRIKYIR